MQEATIYCNSRSVYYRQHKDSTVLVTYTGPLPKTAVDFWRMVWQERSQSIVMLANLVEASSVKCHKYWPETGTLSFGPFNVTITGQQTLADYTTREFSVQVKQFLYNLVHLHLLSPTVGRKLRTSSECDSVPLHSLA